MKPLAAPRLISAQLSIALAVLFALLLATDYVLTRQKGATERLNRAITSQHESLELAEQLRRTSDDLTRMVRSYVATGNPAFKEHFYAILDIREGKIQRPRRYDDVYWDFVITGDAPQPGDEAGERLPLRSLMERAGFSTEELQLLAEALRRSDRLVELEETAMNALEGRFRDPEGGLSVAGKPDRERALQLLFGEEYYQAKSSIMRPIDDVFQRVHHRTSTALAAAQDEQATLRSVLVFLLVALLVVLPLFVLLAYRYHRVASGELARREERFRSTFEQAAVGIAHVSTAGRFLRINGRFCDILGYTPEEMLARTFQDITHPDDLDADLDQVRELMRGESKTYTMEKRYIRKGGGTVWVNLTVSLLRDEKRNPRWFVSVVEDITRRKVAEAQVHAYQERLRALAADLTLTEERERRRVAGELHDGAVQALASARMRLDIATKQAKSPEQVETLGKVSRLLRQTTLEVNRIASGLSSPALSELGLVAAISEWMKDPASQVSEIETELVDQLDETDHEGLDDVVRIIVFRCVRELLTNIVQHAHATKLSIVLRRVGDSVELTVRDDGVGCDACLGDGEGIGLFAIRERMTDLGGTLKLDSAPNKGVSATLVIPATPRTPAVEWTVKESGTLRTG